MDKEEIGKSLVDKEEGKHDFPIHFIKGSRIRLFPILKKLSIYPILKILSLIRDLLRPFYVLGFPDSSVGKESTCNARDPRLNPGLGRSTGERIGYPLQYTWDSLVAQLVKDPPAVREIWV